MRKNIIRRIVPAFFVIFVLMITTVTPVWAEVTDLDYETEKSKAHKYDPSKDTGEEFVKDKETDSVVITSDDVQAETYEPSKEEVEQVLQEGEVKRKTEPEGEYPVITKFQVKGTTLKVKWKSKGKGQEYLVSLLDRKGKEIYSGFVDKSSIKITDLSPQEKYTFCVEFYEWQGCITERQFETSMPLGTVVFDDMKQSEEYIYNAYVNKQKRIEIYIKAKKGLSEDDAVDAVLFALNNKRLGDYWRSNVGMAPCVYTYQELGGDVSSGWGENEIPCTINGSKYYKVVYGLEHYTTKEQDKEFEKKLKKTMKKLKLKGSDAEKIKKISRYIKKNVKQAKNGKKINGTAYGALVNGEANCKGKATLFYRMAKAAKINSRLTVYAYKRIHLSKEKAEKSKSLHYINLVKCGKKYYYIDVQKQRGLWGRRKVKKEGVRFLYDLYNNRPEKYYKISWAGKNIKLRK